MDETIDDGDLGDFADIAAPLLHDRGYRVRSYAESPTRLRLRGVVRDRKPAGTMIPNDSRPFTMHHMIVDLVVSFPELIIVEASAVLERHPHDTCKRIEPHYENLVGLSIARGFTHKVRELFGGPRGCTHTTALLQAMAPVAVQSQWSMRMLSAEGGEAVAAPRVLSPAERRAALRWNLNSCHVWAEDGEMMAAIDRGDDIGTPVHIRRRLEELGIDPAEWRGAFRG